MAELPGLGSEHRSECCSWTFRLLTEKSSVLYARSVRRTTRSRRFRRSCGYLAQALGRPLGAMALLVPMMKLFLSMERDKPESWTALCTRDMTGLRTHSNRENPLAHAE